MARRSKGERARAAIGAWMPLDVRGATMLVAIGAIVLMLVSLVH
jgi:hypothetical protein